MHKRPQTPLQQIIAHKIENLWNQAMEKPFEKTSETTVTFLPSQTKVIKCLFLLSKLYALEELSTHSKRIIPKKHIPFFKDGTPPFCSLEERPDATPPFCPLPEATTPFDALSITRPDSPIVPKVVRTPTPLSPPGSRLVPIIDPMEIWSSVDEQTG